MADFALVNDIYIGSTTDPLYHYKNANIVLNSPKGVFSVDLIGNELPIDTFSFIVYYDPTALSLDNAIVYAPIDDNDPDAWIPYLTAASSTPPDSAALYVVGQAPPISYLADVPYGIPVYWYVSRSFFAKGYLKSVERTSQTTWKLTCVSGVGLLDAMIHKGGLFTGQTLSTVLADIIGSAVPYAVHNAVKNIAVYGHLPYDTCRNNLHRLLFAEGVGMFKYGASVDYQFRFLGNTINEIPSSRISINGSVNTQLPATRTEIAEHGFFQSADDEIVTLFDNTGAGAVSADHQLVVFDKSPVYGLSTTGTLVINGSNCNHAVVSGTGVLTGRLYQHTVKIIEREDNPNGNQERVVRVTDNELVSALNSQNVARRVLSFYRSTKTVRAKILLETERCGDYVQTVDAYGDLTQGYIHKAEIAPTSVKGATIEIVDGYVADSNGNNYTHRVALDGSGTWQVPDGVTAIRIILVGGGNGGQGGYNGSDGLAGIKYIPGGESLPMDVSYTMGDSRNVINAQTYPGGAAKWYQDTGTYPGRMLYYAGSQKAQPGGAAGAPGTQGKVAVYDKAVAAGEIISFASGNGGAGGAKNGGAGSAGTATTASSTSIGSLSSANGNDNGYYDPLAKTTYGLIGKKGVKGGNGGVSGTSGNPIGCDGTDGAAGGAVAGYAGGAGGAGTGTDGVNYPAPASQPSSTIKKYKFRANGSGGGGAAYGNNGSPGGTFTTEEVWETYQGESYFYGIQVNNAAGGAGADAIAPSKASYGNGGNGGNGGGAGGNASGVHVLHAYFVYGGQAMIPGGFYGIGDGGTTPAPGGSGSKGGDGGDGCVIIYY